MRVRRFSVMEVQRAQAIAPVAASYRQAIGENVRLPSVSLLEGVLL